ncbi:MAG: thioredoxin fold domain-containing protein [Odoribacter sp.]|nr:thioredoxin fold domain-containing protein [Odoribacter sp.]
MKRSFLLLGMLLTICSVFGQGIQFQDLTVEQAIEKAKMENKYVFIDFYTSWCGPCKLMDAQIFPMKEMGDYFNPKFVCIKQNAGKGGNGEESAVKFGVKAYPTFVILNGAGELVHMFAGGVLNLSFIDKIEEAFNPAKAFGVLKKRYDAGERDPKWVASYLEALQKTYTVANIHELVEEFYKTTSDEDKICPECLFLFDQFARVGSEKDEFLTRHRERFRELAGRERVDEIFKQKYVAYYGQIIMGQNPAADLKELEKTSERLATLELPANPLYDLLQTAAKVKITGEGAEKLFEKTKETVAEMNANDLDIYLYYTVIGLQKQFGDAQKKELIDLISSESTKGYVERSMR